jgi:hypothetical protein
MAVINIQFISSQASKLPDIVLFHIISLSFIYIIIMQAEYACCLEFRHFYGRQNALTHPAEILIPVCKTPVCPFCVKV